MNIKFTENDVLRYIYGEMEPVEQDLFLDALVTDEKLLEAFEVMQMAQEELEPVQLAPSESSVNRVMRYASRAAQAPQRREHNLFFFNGKDKVMNFHHLVSVVMVFFTCITITTVMYMYNKAATPENNWGLTSQALDFENHSLDQRLDFARYRLMDLNHEVPLPMHHDTYRLVNADLFAPLEQNVVFVTIK